jgi:hypothetical protein
MVNDQTQPPDCWKCKYFKITHEVKHPYSCDAMRFKSKLLPSIEVIQAHGSPCLSFELKPRIK